MGSVFTKQAQQPPPSNVYTLRRYRATVVGLDGAGKTNILLRLCPRKDQPYPFLLESVPTIGIDFYCLPNELLSPLKHHHHYVPPSLKATLSTRFSSSTSSDSDKGKDKDLKGTSSNLDSSPPSSSSTSLPDIHTTVTPTANSSKEQQQQEQQEEDEENDPKSDAKNIKLLFFDLSGQYRYRSSLRPVVKGSNALIYVLDATATPARFQESRRFLQEILEEWVYNSHEIPLLIYANKMDWPGARTIQEVKEGLGVGRWAELGWGSREKTEKQRKREEEERVWRLQGASAATGDGLMEGIDWLVVQLEVQRCEKDSQQGQRG